MDNIKTTEELLGFLKNSPTAFQAVEEIGKKLTEAGFAKLGEHENWDIAVSYTHLTEPIPLPIAMPTLSCDAAI